MRYILSCTSVWATRGSKDILNKYPILNKYNPIIDYPYPNPQTERLTVEVSDLIKFYKLCQEHPRFQSWDELTYIC